MGDFMHRFIFALLMGCTSLAAADEIQAVLTKKPVRLYATAQDATATDQIAPAELAKMLPLPITEESEERIQFPLHDQHFWASSLAFRIHRECLKVTRVSTNQTVDAAGVRGVGNEGGCTK